MLSDFFSSLFEDASIEGRVRARRGRFIARICFGLLGFALCIAGAVHFTFKPGLTGYVALRSSMVAVFVFFACFWLLNVALARSWRWPLKLFALSFVALFASRILLGP
jgi:hypothetical protein